VRTNSPRPDTSPKEPRVRQGQPTGTKDSAAAAGQVSDVDRLIAVEETIAGRLAEADREAQSIVEAARETARARERDHEARIRAAIADTTARIELEGRRAIHATESEAGRRAADYDAAVEARIDELADAVVARVVELATEASPGRSVDGRGP
jgi:hypothetical protein